MDQMLLEKENSMELAQLRSKGKDIKLVVFDLDGTLLTSNHVISHHSILAIEELKKKGILIAIASGRIYTMLESFVYTLQLEDFIISSNGASIDSLKEKKIISQIFLDVNDAKRLIEFCVNHKIECNVLTRKACFFPENSKRKKRFEIYNELAMTQGLSPIEILTYNLHFENEEHIEKILIHEINSMKLKKVKKFIDQHTNLHYTSSGSGIMDVSPKGITKGNAVRKIATYTNIDLNQVCVFGDYDNDISMFEIAGISVVMSNGSNQALKSADFITQSNDDEGIAYAIKEIIL